ncbi:E3 UFM1-protein ligase [Rhynchospora pubera]|uniref:E3 UFM1-protein ligase n=1 Tax=Rhynchospora pubera TaxID=906938 RepID=A0AAV8DX18_9POAL|nr:E3 UFM1-protein ligase [Rhynchospora pubera]KAJ4788270.1 E3 UFM1-protein ligase [Rhynchospora pubera]
MEKSFENAEKTSRLLDGLQNQLNEAVLNLHIYAEALHLFEDDPSTSDILHKHLLDTVAAPIADKLLHTLDMNNKLKHGVEIRENENEALLLSTVDRASLAKALPESLSIKAQSLVETLAGKRVESFMDALKALADESGLIVKNPDESLELSKLQCYYKDLTEQISSETDYVAFLPKVVALLFFKVYNKAILVPEKALSAIITRLQDKLADSAGKLLTEYHNATATLLALRDAATGAEDEDCLVDRILTKEELLQEMMPKLKVLALRSQRIRIVPNEV